MQACKAMTYFDPPIFCSRCKHLRINTEDRIIMHHKSFLKRFYIFSKKLLNPKSIWNNQRTHGNNPFSCSTFHSFSTHVLAHAWVFLWIFKSYMMPMKKQYRILFNTEHAITRAASVWCGEWQRFNFGWYMTQG
jgi:hypothetical protein